MPGLFHVQIQLKLSQCPIPLATDGRDIGTVLRASLINSDSDDMAYFSGRSCGKRLPSFSVLRFLPASELVLTAKPSSHPTCRCLARQKALVPSCVFTMCHELIIPVTGLDYSCSWMGHGRRSCSLGLGWNFRWSYQSCGRDNTFKLLICAPTPFLSGHIGFCHIQGLSMEESACKYFGLLHYICPIRLAKVYMFSQLLGGIVGAAIVYGNYFHAINIYEGGNNIRTLKTAGLFAVYPVRAIKKGNDTD